MQKAKINKVLNWVKYSCMILFILFLAWVMFFEQANFCVTTQSSMVTSIDEQDKGTKCFKSMAQANEYKLYLIDKYDIGKAKEQEIFLPNLTLAHNIYK